MVFVLTAIDIKYYRMKFKLVTLLLLFSFSPLFSQIIKFEGGTTISYLRNKADFLSDPKFSFAGAVGVDYMERKYFYLSSSLAFQHKGALDNKYYTLPGTGAPLIEKLSVGRNYMHFNTTFRGRIPLKKGHIFLGAGPKIELLFGKRTLVHKEKGNETTTLNVYGYKANRWSIGGIVEIGYNHYLGEKFIVGLKADYMTDFKALRQKESKFPRQHQDAFRIMASFGIRLYE